MVDATYKSFDASDRSYYAILKKEVHNLAVSKGFPPAKISQLDIIAAEMTSNLHKYAVAGELLLGYFDYSGAAYIELICLDKGPGMRDTVRMMKDGFSTSNTMGHGLGSIKRLSDVFDIFSHVGWGTMVLSRIYKSTPAQAKIKKGFQFKEMVIAKPKELVSGDACYLKQSDEYIKFILCDGLGHGPEANLAANEAIRAFKLCPSPSPVDIIRYIHPEVRKTRGLVATIVIYDVKAKQLRIGGVGNIATKLTGPLLSKSHLSYNGIIGHNIPNTMNDLVVDAQDYSQVILCSDGIRSRWETGKLPGLNRLDLSLQAAAVYKDYARLSDDMSVVIAKF